MIRRAVLLSCIAFMLGPSDPADGSTDRCRSAVGKASARLAREYAKTLARCQVRVVRGDLPASTACVSEAATARRLALAEATLRRGIADACGGADRTCGAGGDDASPTDAGWHDGVCPGVLGSPCTMPVAHCGDVAECLVCSAREAASGTLALAGDRFDVPASDATADCQEAITNATARYFAARTRTLQRCAARLGTDGVSQACIPASDVRTRKALARAERQMGRTICRACGGADARCDGDVLGTAGSRRGDDPSPTEIALRSSCPDVTPPGGASSCAGDVASLSDAIACLACTTRHRGDCTALATASPGRPLPPECRRAAICDPGYTGLGCDQLRADVVPELASLPDPDHWLSDGATGRRYRRATRRERLRYGWLPGTFLVEAPAVRTSVNHGKSPIELAIPTADDQVHRVLLDLAHASRREQTIEVRAVLGEARAQATFPVFFDFLSRTPDRASFEALVHLVAVGDGGASLNGIAGSRKLDGYLPIRALELDPRLVTPNGPDPAEIAVVTVLVPDAGTAAGWSQCHGEGICGAFCDPQGITAPCSADAYNPCCEPYEPDRGGSDDCHDGFDNDFDGQVDQAGASGALPDGACNHSEYCVPNGSRPPHSHPREAGKQFILLGEIHLCSWFADQLKDWRVELHRRAGHIVGGFEEDTGYDPWHYLTDHRMGLRFVTAKCWILDDLEQARACKDGDLSDCDPFDTAPHVYPYAGAGNTSGNYLFDQPRADMAHAVSVGLWQPVNLVQVLMATAPGEDFIGGTSPRVAGRAEGAYSVVKWTDTAYSENFNVSNHELGHSFGFSHCDAEISPIDGACTIMGDDHNTTGNCLLADICNVPDGHARLSAANAQALYGIVRSGIPLPYHFGNAP